MSSDIIKYIEGGRALEKYTDPDRLQKEAIPYLGQLKRNKLDHEKIFLKIDPISGQNVILEFKVADVLFVEDVKTVSSGDGTAIRISTLWIRRGAVGIKLEAFTVSDLSRAFSDIFAY